MPEKKSWNKLKAEQECPLKKKRESIQSQSADKRYGNIGRWGNTLLAAMSLTWVQTSSCSAAVLAVASAVLTVLAALFPPCGADCHMSSVIAHCHGGT